MSQPEITIASAHAVLTDAGIVPKGKVEALPSVGQRRYIFRVFRPENIIIKLQPKTDFFSSMENEISILQSLPSRPWLPTYISHGSIEGVGLYCIETYLPGVLLSNIWYRLSLVEQREVGRKLGEIAKDLHNANSFKTCGDYTTKFDSIQLMLQYKLELTLRRLDASLTDQSQTKNIVERSAHFLESCSLDTATAFVPIHHDLHIGNILCAEKNGTPTGIIDFEMTCRATPTFELLRLYYCMHWPRRFVHNNATLKEVYRYQTLDLLWQGAQETYPNLFQSALENECLLALSVLYDLESLATSIEKGWKRSVADNINRLIFTLTHRQLYAGDGWL